MRKLTIQRRKSYVACLGKMKVYIQDEVNPDLKIGDVPCRKLGTLKNGEEKTFEIGQEECKVFVVSDRLSRGFSNDFYIIPDGEYDIKLSGQNRYNPATGNAFRFDGVSEKESLQNRKKGVRIGILILIASAFLGFAIGISRSLWEKPESKVFEASGVSIELTDEFSLVEVPNFELCYASQSEAVLFTRETFAELEEVMNSPATATVYDYGGLICALFEDTANSLQTKDGLVWYYYEAEDENEGVTYGYMAFFYRDQDAFWMIQFSTEAEKIPEKQDLFFQWAKSVSF